MRKIGLLLVPGSVLLGWLALSGPSGDMTPTETPRSSDNSTPGSEEVTVEAVTNTAMGGKAFQLHFGLKALFDQFIFEHPELSQSGLQEAYALELKQQSYSLAARDMARSLFTRYLAYKAALEAVDVSASRQQLRAVADRLDARDQLRYRFFSEREYHYLFSRDAAYDKAALARLRIANDPGLNKQQKRELIEAQLATLPDEQRMSFAPSMAVNRLTALRQHYANENSRYQAVAAEFGHDVAERMETRTQQQQAWRQRVTTYAQWESEVREDESLLAEEKTRLIQARRAELFNDNEVRRLQVFLENPSLISE